MNLVPLRALLSLRRYVPALAEKQLRRWWEVFWRDEVETNRQLQREILGAVPFNEDCETFAGSERAELAEAVARFYPFKTLLEFGCAYGQSFHLYSRLFPGVRCIGLDPDADAVEGGRQFYLQHGLSDRITLETGGMERLEEMARKYKPDLIYSSACLLYLSATEIREVLKLFYSSATRGFVLMEQDLIFMSGNINEKSRFIGMHGDHKPYWLHNYGGLFRELFPDGTFSVRRIPKPKFQSELWQSCGAVVTFTK